MTLQQAGFQRDLLSWELGVSSPCPRSAGQHKAMSHTWLSSTSKRCPVPDPPQMSKAESSKDLSLIVSKLIAC